MTPNRHGSSVIEFPNDLEIVTTREFDAPLELVFDVLTKPEHVSKWFAPFACEVTECSIDLRVGGNYHIVFVTEDGTRCSFRGRYLVVEPPTRAVAVSASRPCASRSSALAKAMPSPPPENVTGAGESTGFRAPAGRSASARTSPERSRRAASSPAPGSPLITSTK